MNNVARALIVGVVAVAGSILPLACTHSQPAARGIASAEADAALQVAINPPPISLNVMDANLANLAAALSAATGSPLGAYARDNGSYNREFRYSIAADKVAFWDVAVALSSQHSLYFWCDRGRPFGLTLFNTMGSTAHGVKVAGFFIYPESVLPLPTKNVVLDNVHPQPEEWAITYNIRADPRIAVMAAQPLFTRQVVDDAGHIFFQGDKPEAQWQRPDLFAWGTTLQVDMTKEHGQRTAVLTGEASFIVAVGQDDVTVPDIQKMTGPLELPCASIRVTPGRVTDGTKVWTDFRIEITSKPSQGIPDEFRGRVHVRLIDAAGTELLTGSTWTDNTDSMNHVELPLTEFQGKPLAFVAPIRMVVSSPARLEKVTIPFELKDVPLPGAFVADDRTRSVKSE